MATKKSAKPAPKKASAAKKASAPKAKAISTVMTKSGLVAHLVEQTSVDKKSVTAVLAGLEAAILGSLSKKGVGSFVLPGLLKLQTVAVPAKPKRKGINPFTQQEVVFAAKPATTKVKARPLKKLKEAAL